MNHRLYPISMSELTCAQSRPIDQTCSEWQSCHFLFLKNVWQHHRSCIIVYDNTSFINENNYGDHGFQKIMFVTFCNN